MKAWKSTTTAVTIALALAVLTPGAAVAGQSEWAVAGKILTGIAVAGILFGPGPAEYRSSRVYYGAYEGPVYRYEYRERAWRDAPAARYHERPVAEWDRPAAWRERDRERLFDQPRRVYREGPRAPACAQVWSDAERRWVTVGRRPAAR